METVFDVVFLIGRILFGAIFVTSAIGHFTQTDYLAGYAQSKGIPAPKLATLVGGAAMAVGIASVILGVYGEIGAGVLAAFLIPTAVLMHPYWRETDPQAKAGEQMHFNKDLSLAGAALAIAAAFSFGPGLTVTGPLF